MVRRRAAPAANMITVTVAKMGDSPRTIALEEGMTVADLREQGNYSNVRFKRGGEVLDDDTELEDGDKLFIAAKVEGGRN